MTALVVSHSAVPTTSIICAAARLSPSSGCAAQNSFLWVNDAILTMDANLLSSEERQKPGSKDKATYSHSWYLHQVEREKRFFPWFPALGTFGSTLESMRLKTIKCYWEMAQEYGVNPLTIHLAVWLVNKLLHYHAEQKGGKISRDLWAMTSAVSLRMALKFEEKPECLWALPSIWKLFPIFDNWVIDRSESRMITAESQSLRIIDDRFDVPLSTQFFDRYLSVGGWPDDLRKEYLSLGYYLLALSTFASGTGNLLCGVSPSKLAAASVVLSIKIVNGDTSRSYEFFPSKFAAYCQYSLKDLQPGVKGLSHLLRNKPEEATVLAKLYPAWGAHEWQ